MVAEGFSGAVHSLADSLGALSDDAARDFMQRFPLELTMRELSAPGVDAGTIDATCTALGKVFETAFGAALLPSMLPYAAAALQSPSPPLRRLAVRQAGRLLAAPSASSAAAAAAADLDVRQQAVDLLLQALQDSDVGVASDAEAGLKQLASPRHAAAAQQQQGEGPLVLLLGADAPAAQTLRLLASCEDPVLRMRSLTLLVAVAAQSPGAAAAVRQSELLDPLLSELQDPDDLLSCMAALQLVRDAAEQCDSSMALTLQQAVAPRLAPLLQHSEPVLRSGALRAAASLLSASLEAGAGPMAVDGVPGHVAGNGAAAAAAAAAGEEEPAGALLGALKAVLDVGAVEEFPAELEEAALDAVGILGLRAAGAEALLAHPTSVAADVAYKALGRPPSPAQRIAALHALAAMAGAERLGRSGKLLGPEAEAALRVAVFEGAAAAGAGSTPAEVFHQQLGQPFLEQRVAAYRCLAALAARDWMAGQVCGHGALLSFLADPQNESSKQGCEWRHACVAALAATAADVLGGGMGAGGPHTAAIVGAAERLQAAARAGPFGAGSSGPAEHVVATVPGL